MIIVVAMNAFKGSLTSLEAGMAVRRGIEEALPRVHRVEVYPVADGGDGTVAALTNENTGGILHRAEVPGPLLEPVLASYGTLGHTAIIETAAAAGLFLIPEKDRNPMNTNTFGVGSLIRHALSEGYRRFIIGLGGSATTDAGLGMLTALGYIFSDKDGNPAGITGKDLIKVNSFITHHVEPLLSECTFRVACDVNNPLYGPRGAACVYGPQKGASEEEVLFLDRGLRHFARIASASGCFTNKADTAHIPGAGAAGGLGYAFLHFLNASLQSGVDLIMESLNLEEAISRASLVITGEGKIDFQTFMGKAPAGIARLAKKHHKKIIAFCGTSDFTPADQVTACFDDCCVVTPPGMATSTAMQHGALLLQDAVRNYFSLSNNLDR